MWVWNSLLFLFLHLSENECAETNVFQLAHLLSVKMQEML